MPTGLSCYGFEVLQVYVLLLLPLLLALRHLL
jgi:hypothetical protein